MQNTFLLVMTAGAVITDLKEQKIKNKWIFLWILIGLGMKSWNGGIAGFFLSLGGILVPVLIFWGAFLTRKIGAGDIKLFSAVGSFLGISSILECMMAAMVTGAVLGLLKRFLCGKKTTIHLSVPILISVFCRIGGIY